MITEKPYPQKSKSSTGRSELLLLKEVEIIYSAPVRTNPLKVVSSADAYKLFLGIMDSRKIDYKEFCYLLLLNNANVCLGVSKISEGGITSTVVDIRLIFQLALKTCATKIILCHNHPSGNLNPSEMDDNLTRKMVEAGKLMEIQVLDHLVISRDGYHSYSDSGNL